MLHLKAIVRNKALVAPSSCPIHPKYQAKRAPRGSKYESCTCAKIWEAQKTAIHPPVRFNVADYDEPGR